MVNVLKTYVNIRLQVLTLPIIKLFTQLAREACQLGCPKIVLDHVHVFVCVCMSVYVHTTMLKYTQRYKNWRCTSNWNTGHVQTHKQTNKLTGCFTYF